MKAKHIREGIGGLLRPKSTGDILRSYRDMDVFDKYKTICYNLYREQPTHVPMQEWPLIMKIHSVLKNARWFKERFRVTAIAEMVAVDDIKKRFLRFKIYKKQQTSFPTKIGTRLSTGLFVTNVDQLVEERVTLIHRTIMPMTSHEIENPDATASSYESFIKTFEEILDNGLNESISNLLKPKPKEYIVQLLKGLKPKEMLMKSIEFGHLEGVKHAFKNMAILKNRYINDAFSFACRKGRLDMVKFMVSKGVDPRAEMDQAFRFASMEGHLNVVKFLVDQGANIHVYKDEAFNAASKNNHLDVVKFLVDQGTYGEQVLKQECTMGRLKTVKILVDKGIDIHAVNGQSLRWASSYGHLDVVKFLVSKGADIHAVNDQSLRWASANGYLDVVKFLVSQGANVHANDDEALKKYGQPFMARFLKKHASINESIASLLKGKSEDDIIKDMDADEIWELFQENTEQKWLIGAALDRGYVPCEWDIELAISDEYPRDITKRMILMSDGDLPIGSVFHSMDRIEETDEWEIVTGSWEDFDFLFDESSKRAASSVLSGDAYDFFIYSIDDIYIDDDFGSGFKENYDFLRDFAIEEADEKEVEEHLRGTPTFSDILNVADAYELDLTLTEIKFAFAEAQAVADEYEAFKDIMQALKTYLEIEDVSDEYLWKGDNLRIRVGVDKVIEILDAVFGVEKHLDYIVPTYGWNGTITEDTFFDALINRIE